MNLASGRPVHWHLNDPCARISPHRSPLSAFSPSSSPSLICVSPWMLASLLLHAGFLRVTGHCKALGPWPRRQGECLPFLAAHSKGRPHCLDLVRVPPFWQIVVTVIGPSMRHVPVPAHSVWSEEGGTGPLHARWPSQLESTLRGHLERTFSAEVYLRNFKIKLTQFFPAELLRNVHIL